MATPETKTGHLVELLMDARDSMRVVVERDGLIDRQEQRAMQCIQAALDEGGEIDEWRQDVNYVVQHGIPESVPLSAWRMRRRRRHSSDLPPAA